LGSSEELLGSSNQRDSSPDKRLGSGEPRWASPDESEG
jgi:hypothetical protein